MGREKCYRNCLKREIQEETGIEVTFVDDKPLYFYTDKHLKYQWIANILYEVHMENLDFAPSEECTELRFFTKEEALEEQLMSNVLVFLTLFDPGNHGPKTMIT